MPRRFKKILRSLRFFSHERFIHSVKTALACLIGYAITKSITFPTQWLVITIIVVMCAQINVGSMLQKSYLRFLGTLTGSVLAALTLFLFGNNTAVTAIVIGLAAMTFSYIATAEKSFSDAGTLGAVTLTIILVGQNPSITTAEHRFMEISIGILIAALVSQFVFPIQARSHLRRMQAKAIKQLRRYYIATLMSEQTEEVIETYRDLDEAIVKSLSAQRNLAKHSRSEPFGVAFNPQHFNELLRCEKQMFRSIVCMHYTYKMIPSGCDIIAALPAVARFHESVSLTLGKLARCLEKPTVLLPITIPSLHPVKEAINASRKDVAYDDLIYMDGFLFCGELLVSNLAAIIVMLNKVRQTGRKPTVFSP